uniref:Uncharacterized protein n=1 Tax=Arundo donax TaxID=35708 RepID=A0A0A9CW20_ARUDO
MSMAELRSGHYFSMKFTHTAHRRVVVTLNSHLGCCPINLATVNSTKSTLTNKERHMKVVCRSLHLCKREMGAQVWQRSLARDGHYSWRWRRCWLALPYPREQIYSLSLILLRSFP